MTVKDRSRGLFSGSRMGVASVVQGFRFVYLQHPRLLGYALPPMLIALGLVVGGWILFAFGAGALVEWMWPDPGPETATWLQALRGLATFLVWLVLGLLTVGVVLLLHTVLAAPFGDLLSERVEILRGSWQARPFSLVFTARDAWHSVLLAAVRAGRKLAWLIPLLILSLLVPVVGPALYVLVGGYALAHGTGMDYLDWCAARRGWSWKRRLTFARQHRWPTTGLGGAVLLSFLVPLAYFLAWPAAVAGGTLLFQRLAAEEDAAGVPVNPNGVNPG